MNLERLGDWCAVDVGCAELEGGGVVGHILGADGQVAEGIFRGDAGVGEDGAFLGEGLLGGQDVALAAA